MNLRLAEKNIGLSCILAAPKVVNGLPSFVMFAGS